MEVKVKITLEVEKIMTNYMEIPVPINYSETMEMII